MNDELMIFEGHEIEILTKEDVNFDFDGTVLFNAKQVCETLEYINDRDAIKTHVRDSYKYKVSNSNITNCGFRKLNNAGENFITGKGVISLVQKCKTKSSLQKQYFKDYLVSKNYIEDKFIIETREEIEFFDVLKQILTPIGYDIELQYPCLGFRLDGYIKELNIAIEYDEGNHASYSYEEHEGRQAKIEKELGCSFIRVSDKDNHLWNCGYVIKQIMKGMVA